MHSSMFASFWLGTALAAGAFLAASGCSDDTGAIDAGVGSDAANACIAPTTITASGSYTADTANDGNYHQGSCGGDGPETVFELVVAEPSDVYIATEGSDFDTVLYLRGGDCMTGAEVTCNDDAPTGASWSQLTLPALDAGTYYIFADGRQAGGALTLSVTLSPVGISLEPAVADDPLVRMPGTQPDNAVDLNDSGMCMVCHAEFDPNVEPGHGWKGSMMTHAGRDPLFWAAFAVGLQDSAWALGTPNAGDLCLRCHFPGGWLRGASSTTNGSAMTGTDYDGVQCDFCHRMFDPFFDATHAGTREGNDWQDYWDETDASGTPSAAAADQTFALDQVEAAQLSLFNGNPLFADDAPVNPGWSENGGGQYFVTVSETRRGPFADPVANHPTAYSRYHKSRYFCSTCHDVSNSVLRNLDFADTAPGDGTTVLPSEEEPAYSYFHVERTFSEFMLSDFGAQGGAPGSGAYDPAGFPTSLPGNYIARCQDCHMADAAGRACINPSAPDRPGESSEHPRSGVPTHDLTGGNVWIPTILASTLPSSPNFDPMNDTLLNQGAAVLTLDLYQGQSLSEDALLDGAARAQANLQVAASIENGSYDGGTGALAFRIRNHTGHKLPTGYPEGRRMFVNVRAYAGGNLIYELNPYDDTAATLKGLPTDYSPSSPSLGADEVYDEAMVYEAHTTSSLTGEDRTFHFVLATGRGKDNRIPPRGFRIGEAQARLSEPVWNGAPAPDYYTAAEYAGGYDDVSLTIATGADRVEIRLYYQTTSREYIEFLRDELNGDANTLSSPTPAGRALAYIAGTDPHFSALVAWGDTIWQLWEHNNQLPGAAPVLMTEITINN